MYKGKQNAEESYQIDAVLEYAVNFRENIKFLEPTNQANDDNDHVDDTLQKMNDFCVGKWDELLKYVQEKIMDTGELTFGWKDSRIATSSSYYMVGGRKTIADMAIL